MSCVFHVVSFPTDVNVVRCLCVVVFLYTKLACVTKHDIAGITFVAL